MLQTFQEVKDKEGADTEGYGDKSNLSMSQSAQGSSLAEAEATEQERDKLKQEEVSATKSSITEGICVPFVTSTMGRTRHLI